MSCLYLDVKLVQQRLQLRVHRPLVDHLFPRVELKRRAARAGGGGGSTMSVVVYAADVVSSHIVMSYTWPPVRRATSLSIEEWSTTTRYRWFANKPSTKRRVAPT